jgi:hypothetical protein
MPSSLESPKTRRESQRASMRQDVLGEHPLPKHEQLGSGREVGRDSTNREGSRGEEVAGLEEMVWSIGSLVVETGGAGAIA